MINIEEYRARQVRQPTRWSSLFSTAAAAAGAFVISAFAVLNWDKIPGPKQLVSLLSEPAEPDNKLSFSGNRIGLSETAPLLKICKNVALDVDPDRKVEPTILLQFLASAGNSDRLTVAHQDPRDHTAVEHAAKWGAVADCVYRSNSLALCDINNRALAVQTANTFVIQADEIASKPESYSANQTEVQSLAQVKSRVLDSMQYLVRTGVLIASDFTPLAPASVRQTLAKADPEQNACAQQ